MLEPKVSVLKDPRNREFYVLEDVVPYARMGTNGVNFEGRQERFNAKGNRYINVALTEELYNFLYSKDLNVKMIAPNDYNPDPVHFLKVKMSFPEGDEAWKSRPVVWLITTSFDGKMTRTSLDENTVGEIDTLDIEKIDISFYPSRYKDGPEGVTAYLKEIYVIAHRDYLSDKYSAIPMANDEPLEDSVLAMPSDQLPW